MANPFEMGGVNPVSMPNMPQGAGLPQFPQGAQAGFMQVGNQQRMEAAQELQRQANLATLAQQMAQMEEYKNNAQWREMERQAGMEGARAKKDTAYKGAQADLGMKELGLRKGMATEASEVGAANAGNQVKMSDAQLKKMENLADELATLELDPMSGPAQINDVFDNHGIRKDHPLRQKLMSVQSPEELKQRVSQLGTALRDNVGQQRRMGEIGVKEGAAWDRNQADNATRERIAAMQAANQRDLLGQRNTKDSLKLEADLVKALREAQSTNDPQVKAVKMAEAQQLFQMLQMIRSAGAPTQILPGAEGIERVRPQAQPLPGAAPQGNGQFGAPPPNAVRRIN